MKTKTPTRAWALACALALTATVPAQEPEPDAPPQQEASTSPKKLKDWPELSPADRDRVTSLAGQLKKDREELRAAGREELVQLGAAAVPMLIIKVNDKDESVHAEIFGVFDRVLDARHADLMAEQCRKKKVSVRRYMVTRMCRFHDPDLKEVFQWMTEDGDEDVVFFANLGLAGLHDGKALIAVLESTRTNWSARADAVAEVLPAARCAACGTAVAEYIAKAAPPVQAAGLRLMRYVATPDQALIVRSYLASEDHGVKKEAINAMRVLHGQPPIENLSAFQAIEMAKEWQTK